MSYCTKKGRERNPFRAALGFQQPLFHAPGGQGTARPTICVTFCFLLTVPLLASGCVTHWASNLGKERGAFDATGTAFGDASRVYVQGDIKIFRLYGGIKEKRPAYLVLELSGAQIVSQVVHEGELPLTAFEHPKIITFSDYLDNKDVFIASGAEIAIFDPYYLFVQNPNDIKNPLRIFLHGIELDFPRSTTGKILSPILLPVAVLVDIPLWPIGMVFYCVVGALTGYH
ncbi:MAG: hypothetical protein FWF96_00565 [Kiritimatiellaeota bacterium]|nr:hypothetical protein [Kiritimatiellota bacterium]